MAKRNHPPTKLSWPDESGPWQVTVHWREIDGRAEAVGLELWNGQGKDVQPITATALRDIRPDALISEARWRYVRGLDASVEALDEYLAAQNKAAGRGATKPSPYAKRGAKSRRSPTGSPQTGALRERAGAVRRSPKAKARRGRPPDVKYPAEHWPKVAKTYRDAQLYGKPTATVAAVFDIEYSTASNWVARCRAMGLLPPTRKGKARS